MISISNHDAQFATVPKLLLGKTCVVLVQEREAMDLLDSASLPMYIAVLSAPLATVNATSNATNKLLLHNIKNFGYYIFTW